MLDKLPARFRVAKEMEGPPDIPGFGQHVLWQFELIVRQKSLRVFPGKIQERDDPRLRLLLKTMLCLNETQHRIQDRYDKDCASAVLCSYRRRRHHRKPFDELSLFLWRIIGKGDWLDPNLAQLFQHRPAQRAGAIKDQDIRFLQRELLSSPATGGRAALRKEFIQFLFG